MLQAVWVSGAHLCDEADASEEDSVVLLTQQLASGGHKHLHQVWHLANDACSTQCCLGGREGGGGRGGRERGREGGRGRDREGELMKR